MQFKAGIDQAGVEARVAGLLTRSLKRDAKRAALRLAVSMVDLTTLEGKDTPEKVSRLCYKAMHVFDPIPEIPSVAAVCVYPVFVRTAVSALRNSRVKVASVATGFPAGNIPTPLKIEECKRAVNEGAHEIDMVISRGNFLKGDYDFVSDEIAAVKEVCGKVTLKVILETGELSTLDNVRKASLLAMEAGADFIKTSTGKVQPAATLPVTLVMLEAIRDHHIRTGRMVGMKPAGGISTAKNALQYLTMVFETLGNQWLSPRYFRFGASSLLNDLVLQIMKESGGAYQTKDDIGID